MQKKLLLAVVAAAAIAGTEARAQAVLDLTMITCKQYLSQPTDRQNILASWMSGYFNAAQNNAMLDTARFERNKATVTAYCRKHGPETLMSVIQRHAR